MDGIGITRLLTVEEAGDALGIRRSKAFELVHTGELESLKIGSARRVEPKAVADYILRRVEEEKAIRANDDGLDETN